MKTLKILILIILTGMIGSCKNNNDGYSDEIETNQNPLDTGAAAKDTARSINDNAVNVEDPQSMGSGNSGSAEHSNAGTGTGPSASAEDGATYTSESGLQKDSVRLKKDSIKKKKK